MLFNGKAIFTPNVYSKLRFPLLHNNQKLKHHRARFGHHNQAILRHKHRHIHCGPVYNVR